MTQFKNYSIVFSLLLVLLLQFLVSCSTTHHYLNKNVKNQIKLNDSDHHKFKYVRIEKNGEELIIYGKVNHLHQEQCGPTHVLFKVNSENGKMIHKVAIPFENGCGNIRGWNGASFRAKLKMKISDSDLLEMFFDDDSCEIVTETVKDFSEI